MDMTLPHTSRARLQGIGLTDFEALWAETEMLAAPRPGHQLMRVVEVQRDHLRLHDGQDTLRARVMHGLQRALGDAGDALAVGDWVLAAPDAYGEFWVDGRAPVRNQLARRLHDGRDKVERVVIVSNVDTALLTMGLDHDFNLRRLERYVALVRMAGVPAVVLLTKADLALDVDTRLRATQAALPPDIPALAVSGLDAGCVAALQPWLLPGRTLVLLGSSGTGKSTLTNALCGAAQDTGPTRHGDGRGRHTTTVRSLHLTLGGACIIDTPGLRTLRLDGDEAALRTVFGDVTALESRCRYRNCRHEAEPGCAVREGLGEERLRSWHKLQREARRDTLTALERQRQLSQWKQRSRAGRARARDKRA
jgi:ribosome biogenesis GTPase / thiamine phosphate phosphatase